MTVSFNHFSRVFCLFDPPQDFSPFDSKNSCWLGQTGYFEPLSCFYIKSLTFFRGFRYKKKSTANKTCHSPKTNSKRTFRLHNQSTQQQKLRSCPCISRPAASKHLRLRPSVCSTKLKSANTSCRVATALKATPATLPTGTRS